MTSISPCLHLEDLAKAASGAAVWRILALEHHFADEGKDEPVIITIPKGQYLPVFEKRSEPPPVAPVKPRRWLRPLLIAGLGIVCGIAAIWLGSARQLHGQAPLSGILLQTVAPTHHVPGRRVPGL